MLKTLLSIAFMLIYRFRYMLAMLAIAFMFYAVPVMFLGKVLLKVSK